MLWCTPDQSSLRMTTLSETRVSGLRISRARLTVPAMPATARHPSLASAPAVLQGSGHGRISSAVDAAACAQRLLRHGEVAGRVSQRSSELQSGAVADGADSGLCGGNGAGSISESGGQAGQRSYAGGATVRVAVSVSGESAECDWAVSAVPGIVGAVSRAWGSSGTGGAIFSGAGFYRSAGAVADCVVRRILSGRKRRRRAGRKGASLTRSTIRNL